MLTAPPGPARPVPTSTADAGASLRRQVGTPELLLGNVCPFPPHKAFIPSLSSLLQARSQHQRWLGPACRVGKMVQKQPTPICSSSPWLKALQWHLKILFPKAVHGEGPPLGQPHLQEEESCVRLPELCALFQHRKGLYSTRGGGQGGVTASPAQLSHLPSLTKLANAALVALPSPDVSAAQENAVEMLQSALGGKDKVTPGWGP